MGKQEQLTGREVRVYQVTLADLEQATDLDLGNLTRIATTHPDEAARSPVLNSSMQAESEIHI